MTRGIIILCFWTFRLFSLGTTAFDVPHWQRIARLPSKCNARIDINEEVPCMDISRRSMVFGSVAAVAAPASLFSFPSPVLADTEKSDVTDFAIKDFSVSLPSNWNIITKPPLKSQQTPNRGKKGPTIFSAIDFQSGSVISVVEEEACNVKEYAQSTQICDLVLPSGDSRLFSEETLTKDVSKLLVRHDDRDNTVLQGTSKVDSYQLNSSRNNIVDLIATTTLPSGGTYRDTMGIDRPNMVDRKVKARSVIVTTMKENGDGEGKTSVSTTSILSIWLSAPLDEWQKPVMGTKLSRIWESVKYE